MSQKLFSPATLGKLTLQNHIVMAPMTRSRATVDHIPTPIIAEYYAQRASAGLIITEGTSPSPNGEGYARIPGLYNADQVNGWKPVTKAVHEKGSKIFAQLMHTGRIGHLANLTNGGEVVAPSATAASGQMYTDTEGMQDHPTPRALTTDEVKAVIQEFVIAAQNAIEAGFDGVELHGANGYLIEQFLNPSSNQRTDEFGSSVENRSRFVLETAEAVGKAIGFEKTGIRLSPYGANGDMHPYDEIDETYTHLAKQLNELGLVYIHLVDHSAMGAPTVPSHIVETIRNAFNGTLILSGGYDADRAEVDLDNNKGDLIAFGRPFISNPDLVERFKTGAELNQPDFNTFYTPGEKGYTDYPTLQNDRSVTIDENTVAEN
jgi:N-ethylmaleimide reductase